MQNEYQLHFDWDGMPQNVGIDRWYRHLTFTHYFKFRSLIGPSLHMQVFFFFFFLQFVQLFLFPLMLEFDLASVGAFVFTGNYIKLDYYKDEIRVLWDMG